MGSRPPQTSGMTKERFLFFVLLQFYHWLFVVMAEYGKSRLFPEEPIIPHIGKAKILRFEAFAHLNSFRYLRIIQARKLATTETHRTVRCRCCLVVPKGRSSGGVVDRAAVLLVLVVVGSMMGTVRAFLRMLRRCHPKESAEARNAAAQRSATTDARPSHSVETTYAHETGGI